ncbi:glycosyltransferase [Gallibacterium trehalosifermentans]|uniref:Glycosyltransferase n=1 Tax=Gallibacterium trehalosifermentans TaxID=516935 RepID=A0ABV6GYS8_9PAST
MMDNLLFYPLIICFFYSIFYHFWYKKLFSFNPSVIKIIVFFVIVYIVSLFVNIYYFPYYQEYSVKIEDVIYNVKNNFFKIFYNIGFNLSLSDNFIIGWIIFKRSIKEIFVDIISTFGLFYLVYCWYLSYERRGFYIFCHAILSSTILVLLYSIGELLYFQGSESALKWLLATAPYLHVVENAGGYWPVKLIPNQLHSIFAEPSYLGIYGSVAFPVLFYYFIKSKSLFNWKIIFLLSSIIFILFLSQSRTSMLLFSIVLILTLLLSFSIKDKVYLFKFLLLLPISITIFFISSKYIDAYILNQNKSEAIRTIEQTETNKLYSLNSNSSSNRTINNSASSGMDYFISNNITSLSPSYNGRSNHSRYTVMNGDINIWLNNPFFGVSKLLRDTYLFSTIKDNKKENEELENWLTNITNQGFYMSGFPSLGYYTSELARGGVFSLLVFLFIPLFILYKFISYLFINKTCNKSIKLEIGIISIIIIIRLIAGITEHINIFYIYWVVLGLAFSFYKATKIEAVDNKSIIALVNDPRIKVSIIVPVYNKVAYLERCLDSIRNQLYINIQVILVDDGSTDGCSVICDNYAKLDHRFIAVHQQNQGVSSARNTGLEIADGEYVTFIDADDLVAPEYILYLLHAVQEQKCKISMCLIRMVDQAKNKENINVVENKSLFSKDGFNEKVSFNHNFILTDNLCRGPGVLYSRELIGSRKFPIDTPIGEDFYFFSINLMDCPYIAYSYNYLYGYCINPSSTMYLDKNYLNEVNIWNKVAKNLSTKSFFIKLAIYKSYALKLFFITNEIYQKDKSKEIKCEIIKRLRKNIKYIYNPISLFFGEKIGIVIRLFYILFCIYPPLGTYLYQKYHFIKYRKL